MAPAIQVIIESFDSTELYITRLLIQICLFPLPFVQADKKLNLQMAHKFANGSLSSFTIVKKMRQSSVLVWWDWWIVIIYFTL